MALADDNKEVTEHFDKVPREPWVLWEESFAASLSWMDAEERAQYFAAFTEFKQAECPDCGGKTFEVFKIALYHTAVRCTDCGLYSTAHEG